MNEHSLASRASMPVASAPRPTPAAHARAVRERILEGASRAFAAAGFRGTTVPAIAAEAGTSVGLIYRYFPSKEELFLAVCARETDAKLDELARTLGGIEDARQRLQAAVDQFIASLATSWGSIVVHAWAEADRNPRVRDLLQRLFDQQRAFAALFIREAIARGEAGPEVDVDAVSLAAGLLLHGAIAHQAERGPTFDGSAVGRAITASLAAHLGRPGPAQAAAIIRG
jgi:AcrR family transcriptional regulator